jgi:hypothetical protein
VKVHGRMHGCTCCAWKEHVSALVSKLAGCFLQAQFWTSVCWLPPLALAKPAFNHYISVGGQLLGRQVWQLSMFHVGPAGQMLSCRSHMKHTQLSDAPPKAALLTPTYTRVPNMQMHTTSYQTLLLLGCKACTAPVTWPDSSFCPHSPTI